MLLKIKILDKINCLLGKVILLDAIIMIGCLNCLSFDEQIHKKSRENQVNTKLCINSWARVVDIPR